MTGGRFITLGPGAVTLVEIFLSLKLQKKFFFAQNLGFKNCKNLNNGGGSAVNRAPDGSTYPS